MNAFLSLILLFSAQFVLCRDFYIGMFKRNDFLVAQDVVYREASHFGPTVASYGRLFKCPITYCRVVDRLGMGQGPITSVVRGGLGKKYVAIRIKSSYKLPISVNIYVGCENKAPTTFKKFTRSTRAAVYTTAMTKGTSGGGDDGKTAADDGVSGGGNEGDNDDGKNNAKGDGKGDGEGDAQGDGEGGDKGTTSDGGANEGGGTEPDSAATTMTEPDGQPTEPPTEGK